jgi:deazaflavin-dependent oxidoreductase (nitroreductase family)
LMLLLWRLGLGGYGNNTRWGGSIMVISHTGRKSGLLRRTPLNYAIVDGEIYCTAGFGAGADWYRNILKNPRVEVWLPDSRWAGIAVDASQAQNRAEILRRVLIASGFAAPLFGVNPGKLSNGQLEEILYNYRLVRIQRTEALTGPGGPGDLAWVWPVSTFVLLGVLLLRKKRIR